MSHDLIIQSEILSVPWQVSSLVKPIASVKRLQVNLTMGPDIPEIAVGDDKRLLQTALNVVGNAVEFTKEGYVNVIVGLERTEYPRDPRKPDFRPLPGDNHFYIRVQVSSTFLIWYVKLLFSDFKELRSYRLAWQ